MHIGDGVKSVNLACSGARTYSRTSDGKFKPGIDFYNSGAHKGQALALQEYATTNKNIKAVVVLIGANDYGFADILETCVVNWLTSPSWWKNYCQDDANMVQMFSASNITKVTNDVKNAFLNVKQAMANAGYDDESQYEILAQTYSAPLPIVGRHPLPRDRLHAPDHRRLRRLEQRRQLGAQHRRRTRSTTRSRTRSRACRTCKVLDMVGALYGRRLCENTVGLLEEKGVSTWQSAGAVDKTEWVHQIRTHHDDLPALPAAGGRPPELLGPARAAQLLPPGLQRRRAPSGGYCSRGTGLNAKGEPNMSSN